MKNVIIKTEPNIVFNVKKNTFGMKINVLYVLKDAVIAILIKEKNIVIIARQITEKMEKYVQNVAMVAGIVISKMELVNVHHAM